MKTSRIPALVLAAALAADMLMTMGPTAQGGLAMFECPRLLSLLQVGPATPVGKVYGGGDCDCKEVTLTGSCTAEPGAACDDKFYDCIKPKMTERCSQTVAEDASQEDCDDEGCKSIAFRKPSEKCTDVENCGPNG